MIENKLNLYIEHMWVNHHVFTAERKYIVLAYIAYGSGTAVIGDERFDISPGRESALLGHMLSVMPVIFRRMGMGDEQTFSKNMLVDETIRYIRNNIYRNPKPGDIAKRRFVTIDHLGRVFKQETGPVSTYEINAKVLKKLFK